MEKVTEMYNKLMECTSNLLNLKSALFVTLQSRNVRQRCWHGTEATDYVTDAVQQQCSFRQSAHFLGRPRRMIALVDTGHQQEFKFCD
jgi:hypothetical protein